MLTRFNFKGKEFIQQNPSKKSWMTKLYKKLNSQYGINWYWCVKDWSMLLIIPIQQTKLAKIVASKTKQLPIKVSVNNFVFYFTDTTLVKQALKNYEELLEVLDF